jgi:hypothetical protein
MITFARSNPLSSSNETRKPAGRPSLLSAEQQNALENQPESPAAFAAQAEEAPRRKYVWAIAGASVLAVAAALGIALSGESEPQTEMLAVAAAPASAPAAAPASIPVAAAAQASAPLEQVAAAPAAEASPLAALAPSASQAAAIIDESPPPVEAKPKESLKQMLESGAPVAAKPAMAKAVRKPVKEKSVKPADHASDGASPEEENDLQLLAALVAHAKYDTSANARISLPRALDQCKKQGKQDAARCRIRVCEGRWKKDECRAYSRSKLEKTASGA